MEQKASLPVSDNFPVQVQIHILSNGSEHKAFIHAGQGRIQWFHIGLKPKDIEDHNSQLQQEIEQLSGNLELDGSCLDSLAKLAQKGNYAFKQLFAEGIPRETIKSALRRASKPGAIIELSSDEFFLPWELLYDGPLGSQVDINCFWGMQYIISRTLIQEARLGEEESSVKLSSRPHVGMITCHDLEHVVDKEIPTLEELRRSKRIRLSPLRRLKTSQHDEDLAEFSSFLRRNLQIIHFACHAFAKKPPSQSFLRISDDFDITMEDFGVQEFAIKHNPFVILNACLTGTINPLYTSNWAALFWGRGARGVLATEMRVPDSFAADFIEVLYDNLLSGSPIGEALMNTRQLFWKEKRNPLGLAYALYSSPSIRITRYGEDYGQ